MPKRRANHTGSVRQRKDGRWMGEFSWQDPTTKQRHTKWVYRATERECRRAVDDLYRAHAKGELAAPNRQTLSEYLDWYAETVVRLRVEATTYLLFRHDCGKLKSLLGQIRLEALTAEHIQSAYATLSETLAPVSVKHIAGTLRQALRYAVETKRLPADPSAMARSPRVEQRETAILTADELRAVFRASAGTRWHALWLILACTGMRIGEALALKWGDIDWGVGAVHISRAAKKLAHGMAIGPTKTRRSSRTIAGLPPEVLAALKAHKTIIDQERLECGLGYRQEGLVFPNRHGYLLRHSNVGQAWHDTLWRAKVRQVKPYSLRHGFATLALRSGESVNVVSQVLGHSNVRTTLGRYEQVLPGAQVRAIREIGGLASDG